MTGSDGQVPEAADEVLGPIDFLVVAFPNGQIGSDGLEKLLELADRAAIRILDVEFVTKDFRGYVEAIDIERLSRKTDVDLSPWEGASTDLLDDSDFQALSSLLATDEVAAVVVFENRWLLDVVASWRRDSGRLIADGGVPPETFEAELATAEEE